MRRKPVPSLRLAAVAVLLASLTSCAAPYLTPPQQTAYVPVLPLPAGGSLRDILMRNSGPVGEQDPTTPADPSVRILHGHYYQARELFEALSRGGTAVPSAVGTAVRLPDGSTVTYYENLLSSETTSIGSVAIFIAAKGVPVSQLRFYIPPYAASKCLPGGGCDGGGGM